MRVVSMYSNLRNIIVMARVSDVLLEICKLEELQKKTPITDNVLQSAVKLSEGELANKL